MGQFIASSALIVQDCCSIYEICVTGIVDKDKPLENVAAEEVHHPILCKATFTQ